MEIARAGLAKELEILPPNVNASLRIFGGGASGAEPCKDTRLLVQPATQQGSRLVSTLAGVTPAGEAPLTEAIVQAIGDFDLTRDTHNTLIIITAGLDTCEADAVTQLEILSQRLGIEFDLQLIGLGVSEGDRIELEKMVEAAGGEYHDAQNEADIQAVVAEVVAELPNAPAPSPANQPITGEGQIPLGQYVSGQISTPKDTASYTFPATAGQTVYFHLESASDGTYFHLLAPDGRTEVFRVYNGDEGPVVLKDAGNYTLTVEPDGDKTPSYEFIIWDVNPPVIEAGAIELGKFTGGELKTPGQVAQYTFDGTAGQTIYFHLESASEGVYFQLLDPDGRTEIFKVYNGDQGPVTLPSTGKYTLVVDPDGIGKPTYEFIIWDVNPPVVESGPLTLNQFTGGELKIPGQVAQHTFEGAAGQTIYFHVESTSEGVYFQLLDPDGRTEIFKVYNSDQGPVTLPSTGKYTLVVDPDGIGKPTYEFIIWDVNPPVVEAGPLTLGQFTDGELKTPGQVAQHTFDGTAGQTIYFHLESASEGTYFQLLDPDGRTEIFKIYNSDQGPVTLPSTGKYTLMVDPDGIGKPTYEFIIWDVNPPVVEGGAITLGQPVKGELKIPGQMARYTFEGAAGQNILFDMLTSSQGAYFQLLAPDGQIEVFKVYNGDEGPVALPATGTYTLLVDPDGINKPVYEFVIQSQ
jgi:hypothetical protein